MDNVGQIEEQQTVVVVDDEPDAADVYTTYLAEDYAVRTAYGGKEALELIDSDVDVVLLDRLMPDLSGDEVLQQIRDRGLDCRVVMVTAVDPDTDILDLEFDDYLVKPVMREDIRDAVSRMLERKKYDDAIQDIVAVASKMATLESKLTIEELESSSEYGALEARYNELLRNVDRPEQSPDTYPEFTVEKIQTLFD